MARPPVRVVPRLRAQLLAWYDRNRRDLPWRRARHPYRVWVSEIMLQQTRVAVVQERYRDFLRRFPNLRALAAARRADVLAAWSGLGYYRRARTMHRAARLLVRERGGRFPRSAAELRALPGIGRYTAAAIASIAFGEPAAVVDGNVERVLRRLLGAPGKGAHASLWEAAGELISQHRPGDFNQAMMELGATVCLPRVPLCAACPLAAWCRTRGALEPAPRLRRRKRQIAYGLAVTPRAVYLMRRPERASLMPGMWELPEIAQNQAAVPAVLAMLRHAITSTDYTVRVVALDGTRPGGGRWIPRSRLASLPLTGLTRKILRNTGLLES
ncbi:MAG TPA: A/G-specific adenine glycosylase [Terriglobales bacterium]|nr:A/G-specific adenine glycosylase [Terriglobales bacterium]